MQEELVPPCLIYELTSTQYSAYYKIGSRLGRSVHAVSLLSLILEYSLSATRVTATKRDRSGSPNLRSSSDQNNNPYYVLRTFFPIVHHQLLRREVCQCRLIIRVHKYWEIDLAKVIYYRKYTEQVIEKSGVSIEGFQHFTTLGADECHGSKVIHSLFRIGLSSDGIVHHMGTQRPRSSESTSNTFINIISQHT